MTQTASWEPVNELNLLYRQLGTCLPRGSQVSDDGEQRRGKGREAPIPIRVEVFDLRLKIVEVVEKWAHDIALDRGLSYRKPRRRLLSDQERRLLRGLAIMQAHREWGEKQSWAQTAADELVTVASSARNTIGLESRPFHVDLACRNCGRRALTREHGASFIRCVICGSAIDEREYEWAVKVEIFQLQQNASSPTPGPAPSPAGTDEPSRTG